MCQHNKQRRRRPVPSQIYLIALVRYNANVCTLRLRESLLHGTRSSCALIIAPTEAVCAKIGERRPQATLGWPLCARVILGGAHRQAELNLKVAAFHRLPKRPSARNERQTANLAAKVQCLSVYKSHCSTYYTRPLCSSTSLVNSLFGSNRFQYQGYRINSIESAAGTMNNPKTYPPKYRTM